MQADGEKSKMAVAGCPLSSDHGQRPTGDRPSGFSLIPPRSFAITPDLGSPAPG